MSLVLNDRFAIRILPGYADTPMSDVTTILSAIEQGDQSASQKLLPVVQDELCRLAEYNLMQENPGQTFLATALIHAAILSLAGGNGAVTGDSRGHLLQLLLKPFGVFCYRSFP